MKWVIPIEIAQPLVLLPPSPSTSKRLAVLNFGLPDTRDLSPTCFGRRGSFCESLVEKFPRATRPRSSADELSPITQRLHLIMSCEVDWTWFANSPSDPRLTWFRLYIQLGFAAGCVIRRISCPNTPSTFHGGLREMKTLPKSLPPTPLDVRKQSTIRR